MIKNQLKNQNRYRKWSEQEPSSLPINNSVEWILNLTDCFNKTEIKQSNMRKIPKIAQLRLQNSDYFTTCSIYTYAQETSRFEKRTFCLYSNMLVQRAQMYDEKQQKNQIESVMNENGDFEQSYYLITTSCYLQRKILIYKEFQAEGMIVFNGQGQTYLFFEDNQRLKQWYSLMKRQCKMNNFLDKFQIRDKQRLPNVFTCIKNKNKKPYTVQIYRIKELVNNQQQQEVLMNELNILMIMQHNNLLQYNSLYEDQHNIYVLYEYFQGDSLYCILQQGLKLNSGQVANIIYQVAKLVKIIHRNNLYHGAITPQNIILIRNNTLTKNNTIKVALYNFSYRECNSLDISWLCTKIPYEWMPPEIRNIKGQYYSQKDINFQKFDSYILGQTLNYSLKCIANNNPQNFRDSFFESVQKYRVNFDSVNEILKDKMAQQSTNKENQSTSELMLMIGLLQTSPNDRMSVAQACQHQWFINQKNKLPNKKKKVQFLPSLKTIIELGEISLLEIFNSQQEYKQMERATGIPGNDLILEEAVDLQLKEINDDDYDDVSDQVINISQSQSLPSVKCTVSSLMQQLNQLSLKKHPSKQQIDY